MSSHCCLTCFTATFITLSIYSCLAVQKVDGNVLSRSIVGARIEMTVQRSGSANPPGPLANVAAGAIDSPEHQADVEVKVTPRTGMPLAGLQVPAPRIIGGAGTHGTVGGDAKLIPVNATTDINGIARWRYRSSNVVTVQDAASKQWLNPVFVIMHPSGGSSVKVTIIQHSGEIANSDDWAVPAAFSYERQFRISYKPAFIDNGTPVPITNHSMSIAAVMMDVWEWQENSKSYKLLPQVPADNYWGLVDVTPVDPAEIANGVYGVQVTIRWDTNDIVDKPGFVATDMTVNTP